MAKKLPKEEVIKRFKEVHRNGIKLKKIIV